ncbi:MAG TPA: bifunctional UDP-N-acetylglucosamine diphosphorylase/glucosamine-1-phosphate N-acetyltransferase GlmU [Steroidobacteraceae bacterium]|nr:bifunctional UDP-N-acetylglucosamine diphosphorylase/glucosamine-1-phosphate N-acetyltransferase GlmU [Steroidobacteraceae bacterium]
MPLSVVILAAGQGKRMASDLPKVLQPLAGRPLLAHVIDTARSLRPAAIHVVHGHGGERVREAFPDEAIHWTLQAEQLGTGHAVLQALPAIPDEHTVLVLYGDVPLVRAATLADLAERAGPSSLAVLTAVLPDPAGYGRVIRDTTGRVARIVEHKDANRKELAVAEVNTGLLAAPAGRLRGWLSALGRDNAQGEYYLPDCIVTAVREGIAVEAVIAASATEVLGVNDKLQLAEVEAAHRRERATGLMRAGVTIVDPARIDIRGEVQCGRDVVLDVNVILEGRVRIGDRAHIGPGSLLRDCEIGADTEVRANCVIEGAITGARCVVGPFARLRPGTRLADEVHIGNFVEVKNSELGPGSKANHLSYLGDATIGAQVNVGAVTVTCNYDGADKHRTTIGDGAFIGSGTMLVAPVTVGADATIGAGSTITEPAPPGKLTLERSRQQTLDGWKRPAKKQGG